MGTLCHSGAAGRAGTGIHNHDIFRYGNAVQINVRLRLWIPDPALHAASE